MLKHHFGSSNNKIFFYYILRDDLVLWFRSMEHMLLFFECSFFLLRYSIVQGKYFIALLVFYVQHIDLSLLFNFFFKSSSILCFKMLNGNVAIFKTNFVEKQNVRQFIVGTESTELTQSSNFILWLLLHIVHASHTHINCLATLSTPCSECLDRIHRKQ